jgi:hypothetical protein
MGPARKRVPFGVVLADALVLAGCGGDGADKAGGSADRDPLVLTLGTHDRYFAQASFAEAVRKLSAGKMRVRSTERWRGQGPADAVDFERRLVAATPADLAALRTTVEHVYERIERDRLTRRWVSQLTRMKRSAKPHTVRCSGQS